MKETDTITYLSTGKKCFGNCKGIIFAKMTLSRIKLGDNGIVGPGYSASHRTEIDKEYVCDTCGIHYDATEKNKLIKDEEARWKKMAKILDETHVISLNRKLKAGEIFFKKGKTYSPLAKEVLIETLFVKNGIFRKMNPESTYNSRHGIPRRGDHGDDGTKKKPFIIRGKNGTPARLIWWAPTIAEFVPLSEREKRERRREIQRGSGPIVKIELKLLNSMSLLKHRNNKPLPKNATRATNIFLPTMEKEFYVPKDSIK